MPFIVSYLCLFIVGRFSLILIFVQVLYLNGIVIPICHFDKYTIYGLLCICWVKRIKRSVPHIIHLNSITITVLKLLPSIPIHVLFIHLFHPQVHLCCHRFAFTVDTAHTQQQKYTLATHSHLECVCVCLLILLRGTK